MHKPSFLAFALGVLAAFQDVSAFEASDQQETPPISVRFADSSTEFRPDQVAIEQLAAARTAALIYVSGRTSTQKPSAADEAMALRRALAARAYLVRIGVSPLKIMVNFASGTDFIANNATPEGRAQNQRVDIELVRPPEAPIEAAAVQQRPTTWEVLRSDGTLQSTLDRWARQAGWVVEWAGAAVPGIQNQFDARLTQRDFLAAADHALKQASKPLSSIGLSIRAEAHPNQVLVIYGETAK